METEDKTITISRQILVLVGLLLAGAGSFTGYTVSEKTISPSSNDIKAIIRSELHTLEVQGNNINNQVGIIIYRQTEFERRLERLEEKLR